MKRVLVIDDNQRILDLIKRSLERLGYEAVITTSWEDGIEIFKNKVLQSGC